MGSRRPLGLAAALVLVPALLGMSTRPTLARLSDADTSTKSIVTDTLDPPTALAATGGASAGLTWNATPDTYASGYEVRRATASGGPYTLITTVTPRTTVAATDTPPANGTYFYVLRSAFQNWRSVNSNQATAVIVLGPTATGFKGCTTTSNAADSGGNNNGYEVQAGNACGDDTLSASDVNTNTNTTVSCTNTGKDRHRFWDFGLGVPATVGAVNGIEVRADVGMNNNGGTNQLCVELSSDGGATWTTPKAQSLTAGSPITTYTIGTASDLWGRTWVGSDFANGGFRVRLTDVTSQPSKTFLLEYLAVQVSYTP